MTTETYPVGIIGGTPVDAQMGVHYFRLQGVESVGIGISDSPEEATTLQVLHPLKLQRLVVDEVLRMKQKHQIASVCIYCNSLSAAINTVEVAEETGIQIVTPLDVYRQTAHLYEKVGLLAANCQSLRGIEKAFKESNDTVQIIGTATLSLVTAIENNTDPELILQEQGLIHLLRFFEASGVSALILGCTHFPYLQKVIESNTSLRIIDPSAEMVNLVQSG